MGRNLYLHNVKIETQASEIFDTVIIEEDEETGEKYERTIRCTNDLSAVIHAVYMTTEKFKGIDDDDISVIYEMYQNGSIVCMYGWTLDGCLAHDISMNIISSSVFAKPQYVFNYTVQGPTFHDLSQEEEGTCDCHVMAIARVKNAAYVAGSAAEGTGSTDSFYNVLDDEWSAESHLYMHTIDITATATEDTNTYTLHMLLSVPSGSAAIKNSFSDLVEAISLCEYTGIRGCTKITSTGSSHPCPINNDILIDEENETFKIGGLRETYDGTDFEIVSETSENSTLVWSNPSMTDKVQEIDISSGKFYIHYGTANFRAVMENEYDETGDGAQTATDYIDIQYLSSVITPREKFVSINDYINESIWDHTIPNTETNYMIPTGVALNEQLMCMHTNTNEGWSKIGYFSVQQPRVFRHKYPAQSATYARLHANYPYHDFFVYHPHLVEETQYWMEDPSNDEIQTSHIERYLGWTGMLTETDNELHAYNWSETVVPVDLR